MDDKIPLWVEEFKRTHGRAPAVLHIGNIANNAYRNAKLLREYGIDCDVICYDYYHLMACPEWEHADFEGVIKNQNFPNWHAVNLKGYRRPEWFAQGPLRDCLNYLRVRRQNKRLKSWFLWQSLNFKRSLKCSEIGRFLESYGNNKKRKDRGRIQDNRWGRPLFYLARGLTSLVLALYYLLPIILFPLIVMLKLLKPKKVNPIKETYSLKKHIELLALLFLEKFPDRQDKLVSTDLWGRSYAINMHYWRKTIKQYDLIQAYATDPILPLLADFRPYVAYEHGTLRDFTMADDPVCRNTSLAYNLADHVFITNGDCLGYAQKIGVTRYSAMLHPIDEKHIRGVKGNYGELHTKYGAQYLFLCTLRHDWSVKGTDVYIRALPGIAALLGRNFKVLMTRWGAELDESEALAKQLGVSDLIAWIEPLNRHQLFRYMKSIDILFDQIKLPHFGATAPEGIAAEVPVIMSYEPTSTAWIVAEPAPILSAFTPEDVVACVQKALDPVWKAQYQQQARHWIDAHHSSKVIASTHLDVYQKLLSRPSVTYSAMEAEVALSF